MKKAVLAVFLLLFFLKAGFAAEVIYKTGTVKLKPKGEDYWMLIQKGAKLGQGDKVKTFKNSSCEIAFDDERQNILKTEEDSEITLDRLGSTSVSMDKGSVLTKIGALEEGSTFEVRTPTAVSGAAGTGWGVDTDGKKTTIFVFENDVYLLTPGDPSKRRVINAGHKTTIGKKQYVAAAEFVILTNIDNSRWNGWCQELEERLDEKGRMDRIREIDQRFDERFGTE